MTLGTIIKETVRVQFNEVKNSGVFIAQIDANRENSMSILQQNGFRAMTYQEALVKIDQNPELKEQLKGNWFYLEGKGSALSGYYTFNEKGELTQGKGDVERTGYVWKGGRPLSLDVHTDNNAHAEGMRYNIDADVSPDNVARMVVGVRACHKAAESEWDVSYAEKLGNTLSGTSLDRFKELCRGAELELSILTKAIGLENLPNMRKLIEALRIKE